MKPCYCGQPARGRVPDNGTPASAPYSNATHHYCRQCSPEHCLMHQAGLDPSTSESPPGGEYVLVPGAVQVALF